MLKVTREQAEELSQRVPVLLKAFSAHENSQEALKAAMDQHGANTIAVKDLGGKI